MVAHMKGRKQRVNPKTVMYDLNVSSNRRSLGPPMNPKTHVPRMLSELSKREDLDTLAAFLSGLAEGIPLEDFDFKTRKHELVLTNPEFVGELFDLCSQLDPDNRATDRAIIRAFEAANLNVKNPLDWRILLERFCWAHFGDKGKPGKAIYWTDEKYCELLRDVHQAKRRFSLTEDASALRKIMEIKGKKYRQVSFGRMKKALGEARNPKYNGSLMKPVYNALAAKLDARLQSDSAPYSQKEIKALERNMINQETDRIGSS